MSRDRLRTTESPDGRKIATWRLVRRECQVLNIQNRADASPAYRWPTGTKLPAAQRGLVILDGPPNLWEARTAFPAHLDVLDAVRSDYWDVVRGIEGCPDISEVVPSRPNEIAQSVRKLLAEFHEETHFKLDLAPLDSAPIYERADGAVMSVDEDGSVSDSDAGLDKADTITIEPTTVRDIEE